MMKSAEVSLVFCIFILSSLEVNSAAISVADSEHPDYPGFCLYNGTLADGSKKFLLKPGQKRRHPTKCVEIHCSETFGLSSYGCVPLLKTENCHYIFDINKPYPRCCGELIC